MRMLRVLGLLLLRVPLYVEFGSALNWTGKIDIGTISLPFKSNATSYVPMLLYSFYSFGVVLAVFLIWVLLLSALKSAAPESDSLRQLLQLHLGRVERREVGLAGVRRVVADHAEVEEEGPDVGGIVEPAALGRDLPALLPRHRRRNGGDRGGGPRRQGEP